MQCHSFMLCEVRFNKRFERCAWCVFLVAENSVRLVRLVRLKVQLSGPLSWLQLGIFWRALRRHGER
jgi:hypothetical protein